MSRAPLAPSGDERIDRSMDAGEKPASALPDMTPLSSIRQSHPMFFDRVTDALYRLEAGESAADVRALHGGVVLRDAQRIRGAQ